MNVGLSESLSVLNCGCFEEGLEKWPMADAIEGNDWLRLFSRKYTRNIKKIIVGFPNIKDVMGKFQINQGNSDFFLKGLWNLFQKSAMLCEKNKNRFLELSRGSIAPNSLSNKIINLMLFLNKSSRVKTPTLTIS